MKAINSNIKVLREEARISQQEFAEALGVDVKTVKSWENGKLEPSCEEIKQMCPLLRIHYEDLIERDILAERINAGKEMKKNGNRSTYDWYYGNRLTFAFYLSYIIIIPVVFLCLFLILGKLYDAQLSQLPVQAQVVEAMPSKLFIQIVLSAEVCGFISAIYLLIYLFKKGIIKFQWWMIFIAFITFSILTFICTFLVPVFYIFAIYKGLIRKGKNH